MCSSSSDKIPRRKIKRTVYVIRCRTRHGLMYYNGWDEYPWVINVAEAIHFSTPERATRLLKNIRAGAYVEKAVVVTQKEMENTSVRHFAAAVQQFLPREYAVSGTLELPTFKVVITAVHNQRKASCVLTKARFASVRAATVANTLKQELARNAENSSAD